MKLQTAKLIAIMKTQLKNLNLIQNMNLTMDMTIAKVKGKDLQQDHLKKENMMILLTVIILNQLKNLNPDLTITTVKDLEEVQVEVEAAIYLVVAVTPMLVVMLQI